MDFAEEMAGFEAFLALTDLVEADRNWVAVIAWMETGIPEIASQSHYLDYERRRRIIEKRLAHLASAERTRWRDGAFADALGARMGEWEAEAGRRAAA